MYAAVTSFESGSRLDWMLVTNVALTAEKRPAYMIFGSVLGTRDGIMRLTKRRDVSRS